MNENILTERRIRYLEKEMEELKESIKNIEEKIKGIGENSHDHESHIYEGT